MFTNFVLGSLTILHSRTAIFNKKKHKDCDRYHLSAHNYFYHSGHSSLALNTDIDLTGAKIGGRFNMCSITELEEKLEVLKARIKEYYSRVDKMALFYENFSDNIKPVFFVSVKCYPFKTNRICLNKTNLFKFCIK